MHENFHFRIAKILAVVKFQTTFHKADNEKLQNEIFYMYEY